MGKGHKKNKKVRNEDSKENQQQQDKVTEQSKLVPNTTETKAPANEAIQPAAVNNEAVPKPAAAVSPKPAPKIDQQQLQAIIKSLQWKSKPMYLPTACKYCNQIPATTTSSSSSSSTSQALLWCAGCRLIKYCSKSHQEQDWNTHKTLCKVVRKYLKRHQLKYLYEKEPKATAGQISTEYWLQTRMKFVQEFQQAFSEPSDQEIFLFPAGFCSNCHEFNPNPTEQALPCVKCQTVSFCNNKDACKNSKNKHNCQQLRLFTKLTQLNQKEPEFLDSIFIGFSLVENSDILKLMPGNIQNYFFRNALDYQLLNEEDEINFVRLSEVVSVPLTIIWAMSKVFDQRIQQQQKENVKTSTMQQVDIDNMKVFTIHIIGINQPEFECLKWELHFLHLFPKLVELNIVFISPEQTNPYETPILCSNCTQLKRGLRTEYKKMSYDEFKNTPSYQIPDLVFVFNPAAFYATPAGSCSIYNSIQMKPPCGILIVTEFNKAQLKVKAQEVGQTYQKVSEAECVENGYRSLRPERIICVSGEECLEPCLIYRNHYVALFTTKN